MLFMLPLASGFAAWFAKRADPVLWGKVVDS